MASAEPADDEPADEEAPDPATAADSGDGGPADQAEPAGQTGDEPAEEAGDECCDESGDGSGESAAADEEADEYRPTLEQRFSPWLRLRTTVHRQGLVVEVNRLFRQRVAAVDFDRLVLEPSAVIAPRRGLLWTACAGFGGGLLLTLPSLSGWSPAWLPVALAAGAALCLFVVAVSPRRVTMFLDREQVMHPLFLRGRPDEPLVEAFVADVRRAAIAWRCRPPSPDDEEPAAVSARRPRLADTLDALQAMRQDDLITDGELEHFREMAQRR